MGPARALILLFLFRFALIHEAATKKKNYIVYMGDVLQTNTEAAIDANNEILASVTGSVAEAQNAVLHHYTKSFSGFSAMLTPEQAQQLERSEKVISVFESNMKRISTTRSWNFLEIDYISENDQLPMNSRSEVIVGMIDTGIWPESPSFSDGDLGPVPEKFRGECVPGDHFNSTNCNRKIIGARFYYKGFEADLGPLSSFNGSLFCSARDTLGHGTHTASTVAGSAVANVSLYGIAAGTARGGAPHTRLAIYKVCWFLGLCSDADVLAAMDDAISDGVDIISISLGSIPKPYLSDATSIGALHAFQKGILVCTAAGNSFLPGTVGNVAPWILTVAASTIDRELLTSIKLGNSEVLEGSSLNHIEMEDYQGLIAGSDAHAPGVSPKNASTCVKETLDPAKIQGKIVVCQGQLIIEDDESEKHITVKQAGGHGIILIDSFLKDMGFLYQHPIAVIGQKEGEKLQNYMAREKNPIAKISKTETHLNTKPAPKVASFSSKGPNILNPEIIKPDIAGPGVNILAAWSPAATTDTLGKSVNYNIVSGTSMSCPHITAIAAILKSRQPSWSPAALKSAIMTTATGLDNTQSLIRTNPNDTEATPFDFGSGQVNAVAAANPGLIYDFDSHDILHFLCSTNTNLLKKTPLNKTEKPPQCSTNSHPSYNLNYPSIGIYDMNRSVTVTRTVAYYGSGKTTYVAFVEPPLGVSVTVTPSALEFEEAGEKKLFRVRFVPKRTSNGRFVFGALTWSNGTSNVRSPIALRVPSM